MFHTYDKITVKAGKIGNLSEDIETTVGRYLFNMFILDYAFDSKIPYFNKTLNGKNYGDLIQTLCDKLLEDVITGEQMAEFQKRIC